MNMKRPWIITIIICLLLIGGGIFVIRWPRTVPFGQCSEVYRKYAGMEGVKASFVKDFYINDTLCVDVTVLAAADTSGWNTLKNDFCLPVLDSVTQRKIDSGKDLVFMAIRKKGNCCETADLDDTECDVRATSFLNRTICLFHVKSLKERSIVEHYSLDISINNSKKK